MYSTFRFVSFLFVFDSVIELNKFCNYLIFFHLMITPILWRGIDRDRNTYHFIA